MNFCENCGADIREHRGANFCWSCGNRLEDSIISIPTPTTVSRNDAGRTSESNKISSFLDGYDSYGIIFTHIHSLANCLDIGDDEVRDEIQAYISNLETSGHQYLLLDAGNNSYRNLDPDDNWESFVDLLSNVIDDFSIKPDYLFIIGGHDVVPMAVIENGPRCYDGDSQIETDMPYSYLISNDFESSLWNGEIFKESVQLFVGRYPVFSGMGLYYFQNNLQRTLYTYSNGLDINACYAMTANSWVRASQHVVKNINISKKIYTSPEIDINSVDEVFNQLAHLYYFNLHGSDAPSSPEFFGDNKPAISPEHLGTAENYNFLMTEACYGGKFIGYDENDSMVLKSLNNKTIAYVGSSKVAFGSSTENISSADVVAKTFIDSICSGDSCGRALAQARVDVFDACPDDHFDYGTTSAAEFNLFGDPIVSKYANSKTGRLSKGFLKKKIQSKSFSKTRPEKKEIIFDTLSKGLLGDVRELVNQEVEKIRIVINKELYSQFNIEPRHLSSVFEMKGKFGEKTYNYLYTKDSNGGIKKIYSVFADKSGKIKSILMSK